MICSHCGAAHRRGRFCNRCGKQVLPAALVGRGAPTERLADAGRRPVARQSAGGA